MNQNLFKIEKVKTKYIFLLILFSIVLDKITLSFFKTDKIINFEDPLVEKINNLINSPTIQSFFSIISFLIGLIIISTIFYLIFKLLSLKITYKKVQELYILSSTVFFIRNIVETIFCFIFKITLPAPIMVYLNVSVSSIQIITFIYLLIKDVEATEKRKNIIFSILILITLLINISPIVILNLF